MGRVKWPHQGVRLGLSVATSRQAHGERDGSVGPSYGSAVVRAAQRGSARLVPHGWPSGDRSARACGRPFGVRRTLAHAPHGLWCVWWVHTRACGTCVPAHPIPLPRWGTQPPVYTPTLGPTPPTLVSGLGFVSRAGVVPKCPDPKTFWVPHRVKETQGLPVQASVPKCRWASSRAPGLTQRDTVVAGWQTTHLFPASGVARVGPFGHT